MPPKKPGDKQLLEQELASLPQWNRLSCKFLADMKADRLQLIMQKLKEIKYDFIKIISKESLAVFAQEKGIYYDMNSMDKKPVKGQADVANELTPQVLAKALSMFIEETDLQGRRAKKEKLDENQQQQQFGKDNLKKSPKKEAKKEAKKGGKAIIQQIAQEEEQIDEISLKQFKKNADIIYLFLDYPSIPVLNYYHYNYQQQEELEEILNENILDFNVIYFVNEKLIKQEKNIDIEKILKPIENFEDDIVKRMNDFIEKPAEQNQEESEKRKSQEQNELQEQQQIQANVIISIKIYYKLQLNLFQLFAEKQEASCLTSPLRNLFLKKQQIILNLLELDSIQIQFDELVNDFIEFVCNISIDIDAFSQWKSTKKVVPVYQSQKKVLEEVKQIESRPLSPQEKVSRPTTKEKAAIDLKTIKKPGKETKKDEQKRLEEEQKKREQEQQELEEKKKKEEKEAKRKKEKEEEEKISQSQKFGGKKNLFFYNKQMNLITDEKTSPAVYLECLVDQICIDEQKILEENIPLDKNLTEQQAKSKTKLQEIKQTLTKDKNQNELDEIFDNVETRITAQFDKNSDQKRKESIFQQTIENSAKQFQIILNENDKIGIRTLNCHLHNLDKLEQRERVVLSMCNYLPGINRQLMPSIPAKPKLIRKAQFQKIIPFISTSLTEFSRGKTLNAFEKLLGDKHPERKIDFSDRIYQQQLDETCLPQVLFDALLFDPDKILHYNEEDDSLLMLLYFKNPPGRILRKYWEYQWKALPNLQNWVQNFKNNENNLNNNEFYDFDYQDFGDIHERVKYMYPNDKSVIICQQLL